MILWTFVQLNDTLHLVQLCRSCMRRRFGWMAGVQSAGLSHRNPEFRLYTQILLIKSVNLTACCYSGLTAQQWNITCNSNKYWHPTCCHLIPIIFSDRLVLCFSFWVYCWSVRKCLACWHFSHRTVTHNITLLKERLSRYVKLNDLGAGIHLTLSCVFPCIQTQQWLCENCLHFCFMYYMVCESQRGVNKMSPSSVKSVFSDRNPCDTKRL